VRYEWDERKNRQNQSKHGGISFELATLVFEDEDCLIGLDRVDQIGEQSWHAIGAVSIEPGKAAVLLVVQKSSESSQPAGLKTVNSVDIKGRVWTEQERLALRRASQAQQAGEESDLEFSEIPRLTEDQLSSLVRLRGVKRKVAVSVRLDPQVLDWLRSKGQGHLTRINDILTNLMEAERRTGSDR